MTLKELAKELAKMHRVWVSGIRGDIVYVSGNTYPNKDTIIALGGKFNRQHACWEFHGITETKIR